MPTAGRLAGAVTFALFGWYLATLTTPFFPEGRPPGFWMPVATVVSLWIGWQIVGKRAGRGYHPAIGIGLTAGAAIAFSVLFVLSAEQMIQNAMRLRYDGPTEAIIDIFKLMVDFARNFNNVTLVTTLLVGGVISSWITEYFGKRFP